MLTSNFIALFTNSMQWANTYSSNKLCIKDFKVSTGPEFDVVIILSGPGGNTARSAYPVASGTCGTSYTGNQWRICPFGFSDI